MWVPVFRERMLILYKSLELSCMPRHVSVFDLLILRTASYEESPPDKLDLLQPALVRRHIRDAMLSLALFPV